jgi:hypothetical protein
VLALVAGLLVGGGLVAHPAAATAPGAESSGECGGVVADLRAAIADLPNKGAQPGTLAFDERNGRARQLFTDADNEHPSCRADIEALGFELAAAARRQATIKGTPFWGPIGWMWNNVYYRVFNANNVMMALFGWALLLSPFILALSAYWVLRGARGAFHRPFVPEHLRTDS